ASGREECEHAGSLTLACARCCSVARLSLERELVHGAVRVQKELQRPPPRRALVAAGAADDLEGAREANAAVRLSLDLVLERGNERSALGVHGGLPGRVRAGHGVARHERGPAGRLSGDLTGV